MCLIFMCYIVDTLVHSFLYLTEQFSLMLYNSHLIDEGFSVINTFRLDFPIMYSQINVINIAHCLCILQTIKYAVFSL